MPRTSLRDLVLAFAFAFLAAPPARAQTTGTLVGVVTDAWTGAAVADVVVIATGENLPGEQVAVTGADGTWRLSFLPPGPYSLRLTAAGYVDAQRSDLFLKTDRTLKVAMPMIPSTVTMDEQVVVVRVRPTVDPTSAQTGVVLPESLTTTLPIPVSPSELFPSTRSFDMAALATAGAEADPLGVGFLGGQSAENRYYIGGFDVTDPIVGANAAPLILDFIEEVDVKTGNYLPKYGRASGGIVSAVTKSGSNEVHGSVFTNLSPRWAFQRDGEFTGSDGQAFWTRDRNSRGAYDLDFGLELGGPVMKDRLWFHAGFAPVLTRNVTERTLRANTLPDASGSCPAGAADLGDGLCRDGEGAALQVEIPAATRRWPADTRSYQFTGKLTWMATPDHTFTLSTIGTPHTKETVETNTADYRRYLEERRTLVNTTATWTGRFLSRRLLVEGLAGWMIDDFSGRRRSTADFDAGSTPFKFWYGPGFSPLPLGLFEPVPAECEETSQRCVISDYATGGSGRMEQQIQRFSSRLSASYLFSALGAHATEGGLDVEWSQFRLTNPWATGARYNMFVLPSGVISARGINQGYVEPDPGTGLSTPVWADRIAIRPVMFTPALYLQDQWQPHPSLTLNVGVRWESQSLYDSLRREAVELQIRDAVAPRLQAIWDPGGRGRSKIAAGWGRFYETPSLDLANTLYAMNFRSRHACPADLTGTEPLDPRTDCALLEGFFDGETYFTPDSTKPVAPEIDGAFVDHFVLSAEHDLWRDVSVGIEYQGRRLGSVIEDMGTRDLDIYYLANPGVSRPFEYKDFVLDGRSLDGVDPATGRTYSVPVRRPQRSYDGVTLKVTKLAVRGLFGQAAYTLSRLRGDYAGRMQLEYEQYLMPGQTADYDLAEYVVNRRGLLPGDRTHALRLYGGYRWTPTSRFALTLGAGLNSRSGTPVDVRSEAARDDLFGYGWQLAFLVPRGRGGRTPWVTQVDLRGEVDYTLRAPWALRFTVDVFNALDARTALAVDETYTKEQVSSIVGATCSGNPAAGSNPAASVATACPDLAYVRTIDGRPVTVNQNWGRPTEFLNPLLVRFGAALTF